MMRMTRDPDSGGVPSAAVAPVNTLAAFGVATFGIALFSSMDAVMKGLSLALGTYNALVWRSFAGVVISGTLFATGHWRRRRQARARRWPTAAVLRLHATRGAVSTVMAFTFFWGLARVPMAQAVALGFIAPLIALFLAALILGERVRPSAILAAVVAAIGVVIILVGQATAPTAGNTLAGAGSILVSALCYAYNIILMRQQAQVAEPVEIAFFQSVVVSALFALALPWFGVVPTGAALPAVIGAALLATGSLLLLSWAYARGEASYLATTEYSAFLWASLFGFVVFGERLSAVTLVGAALIVAGCIVAARGRTTRSFDIEAAL